VVPEVRFTVRFAASPGQMLSEPEISAIGAVLYLSQADPDAVSPGHPFASVMAITR
jgi:hypothetical protein